MTRSLSFLFSASVALATSSASAAVISQSGLYGASGSANYGQHFELESTFFSQDQTLDSITFYKGNSGGGSPTVYLDIYSIGTANIGTLDFSDGTETGNLAYLGSSNNAVDYTVATGSAAEGGSPVAGDALTWTFSGITLPTDVALFAVLSGNSTDGGYIGASLNIHNNSGSGPGLSFSNISNAGSDVMFGGTPSTESTQDNFYSMSVTAVPATAIPEPTLSFLGGLSLLMLLRRRR